jgi:hypothetical protein
MRRQACCRKNRTRNPEAISVAIQKLFIARLVLIDDRNNDQAVCDQPDEVIDRRLLVLQYADSSEYPVYGFKEKRCGEKKKKSVPRCLPEAEEKQADDQ